MRKYELWSNFIRSAARIVSLQVFVLHILCTFALLIFSVPHCSRGKQMTPASANCAWYVADWTRLIKERAVLIFVKFHVYRFSLQVLIYLSIIFFFTSLYSFNGFSITYKLSLTCTRYGKLWREMPGFFSVYNDYSFLFVTLFTFFFRLGYTRRISDNFHLLDNICNAISE